MLHHSFPDPARASGTDAEIFEVFRRVRDQIRDFVRSLTELLKET
jgi:arsenate reductase